jgi:hypothetical protein
MREWRPPNGPPHVTRSYDTDGVKRTVPARRPVCAPLSASFRSFLPVGRLVRGPDFPL